MGLFQDLHHDGELARHLRANGRAATATITAARPSGLTFGGEPVFDLDLDVHVPDGSVYAVSHRQTVPEPHHEQVAVGARLQARVDPDRPSVLILLV